MIPFRSRGFYKEGDASSLPVIQHHFRDCGEIWFTTLYSIKNIDLDLKLVVSMDLFNFNNKQKINQMYYLSFAFALHKIDN